MSYHKKMVGEHVYISPIDKEDAEKYIAWMNDGTVAKNYGHYTMSAASKEDLKWLFEPPNGYYRYAIVLLDGDILLGSVSLHDINHINRTAFIGIFIGDEKYRGKGYGAEAVRLILEYGFKAVNLNNIMLSVHADNAAAISCYKKVGFHESGRRREWVYKDGKYVDVIYMDMLAREFEG